MRTLVVTCHPLPDSFTAAVAERAVTALRDRGDEMRVTDLYAEGFDPLFTAAEREHHLDPGPDPAVAHHAADLKWCERLVLVYPTWWSGQPAMMPVVDQIPPWTTIGSKRSFISGRRSR